ncbi:membrane protein [Longispora fulva]|uniref:L-ascorbate metabolism protein UlaG (Beta-lactamase superfamily) n=1 Tax=Longispora fulva TaxID=619741 RepID=A0A8J7GIN8_9ACTN|nr:MBL fold metallo-hydrolase [Longispora fulva]MBG6137153.1 L-ascorbate metabolism protein UlaG (beta-lactamase superfamily) [Longispora fulva]GIG61493.1 membrane protein [Longispora fulva]
MTDYRDRLTDPLPGLGSVLRVLRSGGLRPKGEALADVPNLPVRRDGLPPIVDGQASVTWIGHATYVVRINGLTVLTDPVWSRKIPGVPARWTPPGVDWADLPSVDAVVISHNHYDHLDAPTIKRLPRDTAVFVPAGLARWFTKRGFTQVTELDWYEHATLAGLRLDFVPAHHWSRRTLTDTCRSLWGGWILDERVFFAGDTGYGRYFAEIGARYPDLDVALMPVGAYAPRWMMKPVHMDPSDAVLATGDLGARRMATMHWGTFGLTREPVLEPVVLARQAWAAAGRAPEDLWDLAVGESRVF